MTCNHFVFTDTVTCLVSSLYVTWQTMATLGGVIVSREEVGWLELQQKPVELNFDWRVYMSYFIDQCWTTYNRPNQRIFFQVFFLLHFLEFKGIHLQPPTKKHHFENKNMNIQNSSYSNSLLHRSDISLSANQGFRPAPLDYKLLQLLCGTMQKTGERIEKRWKPNWTEDKNTQPRSDLQGSDDNIRKVSNLIGLKTKIL